MRETTDIVIVGAGAAGLMAGISAGRSAPGRRIVLLDGSPKLGTKILIAGGGRCNVTHERVVAADFAGSSRNAIRKVLRQFDVPQTIAFFRELGVELKREETGKLFPTTDRARTVLDALLAATAAVGAVIHHPYRVTRVARQDGRFRVGGAWGELEAGKVILATGGKSLPRTGSDGNGYTLAQSLGHQITPRIFPALVPLLLPAGHFLTQLSGLSTPATLEVRATTGKKLAAVTGSTLCTHFGLSGPAVLDISRHWIDARLDDPGAALVVNWLPDKTAVELDNELQNLGRTTVLNHLRQRLPERLVRSLCESAGVDPAQPGDQLRREGRRALVAHLTELTLPVTGDRGFQFAEVTAGGVPLSEIQLNRMESRLCPGLYLCGEICDVDGRIGGFNFQWAWASGYLAGRSAAEGEY